MVLNNWINALFFFSLIALFACNSVEAHDAETSEAPRLQNTQQLYKIKCGICHGSNGKLMIGGAPDLTLTELNQAEIVALINYGKGTMPSQKDILSKKEIEKLAEYVLSQLKQKN
jgi:mono/diheme cytochrome c family protein